jgi:hypothetical protein
MSLEWYGIILIAGWIDPLACYCCRHRNASIPGGCN